MQKKWWHPLPQGGPRCSALVSGACNFHAPKKDNRKMWEMPKCPAKSEWQQMLFKNLSELWKERSLNIQKYNEIHWYTEVLNVQKSFSQDASPQCSGTAHGCWRWDAQALPAVAGTAYSRRSPRVQRCDPGATACRGRNFRVAKRLREEWILRQWT